MSDSLDLIATTPQSAHQAVTHAWTMAKSLTMAGHHIRVRVDVDDDISIKQRRFLHGPVFNQIAEQVRVNGERFVPKVWKEYYRVLFLEAKPVYEMVKLPGHKRATPRRVRQSTEGLTVKQYSEYIDRILAHAATEFSVQFDLDMVERESVRYVAPPRKVKQREEATC